MYKDDVLSPPLVSCLLVDVQFRLLHVGCCRCFTHAAYSGS